ncbi:hypothetical protein D0Z00_000792 [Geotrichum galactomycetum]|uniref:Uncharacterized protein n=1 Tax=Geotrichum galactomycetum TaxID=27317 RepID=A0ACB6V8L9_9ASCO|nr:hypothetical protein D0Z00_000792 [Geotrichum candidum]
MHPSSAASVTSPARYYKRPKLASANPASGISDKDGAPASSATTTEPNNTINATTKDNSDNDSSTVSNPGFIPFSFNSIPSIKETSTVAQQNLVKTISYPVVEVANNNTASSSNNDHGHPLDEAKLFKTLLDHKIAPDDYIHPTSQSLIPIASALDEDSDVLELSEQDSSDEDDLDDEDEYLFNNPRISISHAELLEAMTEKLNHGKPADLVSLRVEVSPAAAKKLKMYLWMNGPSRFLQKYVYSGFQEHTLGEILATLSFPLPENLVTRSKTEELVELVRIAVQYTVMPRKRLPQTFHMDTLVDTIRKAKNIIVLTGAGISTSLGIPDFRSKSGLYNKLSYLGLSDPQEVFDLGLFHSDPSIFYSVAKEILPVTTKFSPTHAFLRLLQEKGKLLRNYTQNIDNLEHFAGIRKEKLVQCHGSFATATCQNCMYQTPGENLFDDIRNSRIAHCPKCCPPGNSKNTKKRSARDDSDDDDDDPFFGVMKPDITFFGEPLPDKFEQTLVGGDADRCDLLLCIGTSLKVSPVSETVRIIPHSVPQFYISKTPISHIDFDLTLLGACDDIVEHLCRELGWKMDHPMLKNKPFDGTIEYNESTASYEFLSRQDINAAAAASTATDKSPKPSPSP